MLIAAADHPFAGHPAEVLAVDPEGWARVRVQLHGHPVDAHVRAAELTPAG